MPAKIGPTRWRRRSRRSHRRWRTTPRSGSTRSERSTRRRSVYDQGPVGGRAQGGGRRQGGAGRGRAGGGRDQGRARAELTAKPKPSKKKKAAKVAVAGRSRGRHGSRGQEGHLSKTRTSSSTPRDRGVDRRPAAGGAGRFRLLPEFAATRRSSTTRRSTTRRSAISTPSGCARTREFVGWFRAAHGGLEWDPPHCTWFADGTLNASHSCLDRHVEAGRGDRVAYHFVPEDPCGAATGRSPTASCCDDVCRLANALRELGIGKGDTVGIYMGMVPETADRDAGLRPDRRAARGGVRRVLAELAGRAAGEHQRARLVITQDEAWRKGAAIPLKAIADEAVGPGADRRADGGAAPHRRRRADDRRAATSGGTTPSTGSRPICEPERVEAEHMLFALHTSGTTAKPKAAVHTTGGYLTYATVTHRWIFDIQRRATCTGARPTSAG